VQLVARLPGDPANVGAGNAEISKIAIGAKAQFVQVLPVLTVFLNTVAKAHGSYPFVFLPSLGKICVELHRLKIANVARQH
jgi:hypothetical protein